MYSTIRIVDFQHSVNIRKHLIKKLKTLVQIIPIATEDKRKIKASNINGF